MRIIELIIDELFDEAGLDAISLVEKPAHESNFLAFSKKEKENLFISEIMTEEEQMELALLLAELGEDENDLLEQGYKITKVEIVTPKMMRNHFASGYVNETGSGGVKVISDPNEVSGEDGLWGKIRYKYVGPRDDKNRDFCRFMLQQNRVFRIEDIQEMSNSIANPEFGQYSIWDWRGSYNCRHFWVKITYSPTAKILNDASIRRGVEYGSSNELVVQESTTTIATANAAEARYLTQQLERLQGAGRLSADVILTQQTIEQLRRLSRIYGINYTGQDTFGLIDIIDDIPVFDTPEEAEVISKLIGCKGHHTHDINGVVGYMPCETHEKSLEDTTTPSTDYSFESYTDYPQYMTDAAEVAYNWLEENGNPNNCMTPVGRARLTQLRKHEPISLETMKRMKSYISRHLVDLDASKDYGDGCGKLAMASWGCRTKEECDSALGFLDRKITEIEESFEIDTTLLTPYVNQTGGTIDEEAVANTYAFSLDEEKREIIGAAIIPNKFIIRHDEGGFYYVYFSKETTKILADKYFKKGFNVNTTNLEHNDNLKAPDTYVTESWIIEDPELDKSRKYGFNFPEGTWIVRMKVDDDKIWNDIKMGKYKGYSIQGFFTEKLIFNGRTI